MARTRRTDDAAVDETPDPLDTATPEVDVVSEVVQEDTTPVTPAPTVVENVRHEVRLYQTTHYDQLVDKSASSLGVLAYPSEAALKAQEVSLSQATASAVTNPATEQSVALTSQTDRVRDENDTSSIFNPGVVTVDHG